MIEKSEVLRRISICINDMDNEELAEIHNELYAIQEKGRIEPDDINSQEDCILTVVQ